MLPRPTSHRPLNLLRYDEDYTYLRGSTQRSGFLDAIKFIPPARGSFQSFLVRSNHAQAEDSGDFVAAGRLETNGHFLLILHHLCGNWVFHIVKMRRAG